MSKTKTKSRAEYDKELRDLEDRRNLALYHMQGCLNFLVTTVNKYSNERDDAFVALFEWADEARSLTRQFEKKLAETISETMPRH